MRWQLAMICCIVICLILSLTYSHFPTDVSFPLSFNFQDFPGTKWFFRTFQEAWESCEQHRRQAWVNEIYQCERRCEHHAVGEPCLPSVGPEADHKGQLSTRGEIAGGSARPLFSTQRSLASHVYISISCLFTCLSHSPRPLSSTQQSLASHVYSQTTSSVFYTAVISISRLFTEYVHCFLHSSH